VRVEPLTELDEADARRLIVGYSSPQTYRFTKTETRERTELVFELADIGFEKKFPLPSAMIGYYQRVVTNGLSFKAIEDESFIGITVADTQWNGIAIVWECHVDSAYRRRGIGRALLASVEHAARGKGLRMVSIETQSSNVPAIEFYRACGYEIGAMDSAFYSNDDVARGEVNVFMRKALL
jgi:ribosomal protein S18 acetylase RimI-like enzyme